MSSHVQMNRMIIAGARRGERIGALARLAGAPATSDERQSTLNGLLSEREAAMHAGDADALAFVEHRLDRLVEQARSGRQQARDPDTGQFAGFDGGVQRRPRPMPGLAQPTSGELLAESILASRIERAERDADEVTIIVN